MSRMQLPLKPFVGASRPITLLAGASFRHKKMQQGSHTRNTINGVYDLKWLPGAHVRPQLATRSQGTGQEEQVAQLRAFAQTSVFKYWIQGAVFIVVLAGVDAAYSGDWSRIGVISKEFEDSLKPLVIALGVFHIVCATVAGRAAASKNLAVGPAVAKVLAVGFLAMVEVLAADPKSEAQ